MTNSHTIEDRDLGSALRRGAKLRCPRCGQARLFRGYLKVADHCDSCGLDLTPQRADDGPAYIVILIVCHVMGFALHILFNWMRDDPLQMALILCVIAVAMSLAMLPPIKGCFIAFQWAKKMHGF